MPVSHRTRNLPVPGEEYTSNGQPHEDNNAAQNNSKPAEPVSALASRIAAARSGTDEIVIGSQDGPATDIQVASMAEVAKKIDGIKYLLKDWVPFGMPTMLVAEPGTGKSAFALFGLVRPVVTGCEWFNGRAGPEPGYVLWCDTEGTAAITVQRIRDWGLPQERILVPFADDPLEPINLAYDSHLERVEAIINAYRTPLVVIDSLRGAHGEDENNSRIAGVLQKLAGIAQRTNAAIVIVHHTHKLMVDEELTANSSRGSNAILALVRSQLGIDRPNKGSEWRRLRMLKENLGLNPRPVGFSITSKGLEFGEAPRVPQKETEKDRAEAWLKAHMEPGEWYKAGELEDEAGQDGISETALRRARSDLGIVKPNHLRKVKDAWEWMLPGSGKTAGKVPGEIVTS